MHNPFDHIAKKVGEEALGPLGLTIVQYAIHRDAHHADLLHDPDPARHAERAQLGLLGRLAAVLCLLEVFAHAPDGEALRACLGKHFAHWEERSRKTRTQNKRRKTKGLPPVPLVDPFLWIIGASISGAMLRKLKVDPAPGWPQGVYVHDDDLCRVGIVAAAELPRDRSTLLVRIMAGGPLLPEAVKELGELPADAIERSIAEDILVQMQHRVGRKPSPTPEEEEFIEAMKSTWEKDRERARKLGWAEGRAEGRNEGRDEGRVEGRNEGRVEGRNEGRAEEAARAVLTALRVRGVAVSGAERERILAEKDRTQLERWLERAILATSVAEVLAEPIRAA